MSGTVAVTVNHEKVFASVLALDVGASVVTVCMASVSKTEAIPRFERLEMTEEVAEEFRRVIQNLINRYKPEWNADDLLFPEYATQSKPEDYEIEHMDLSAYNNLLEQIGPLSSLANIEVFEKDEQFLSGLRFYVIMVQPPSGDPIYFFRSYTPKKMLIRSPWFAVWYHNGTYDRVEHPLLLFDENIDCVSRSGIMLILNKGNFQNIFGFFEEVRKAARETLDTIKITVPIQNFEEFARDCEGHRLKMRKLKNIAAKPYLSKITMDHIKKVIEKYNLPIQIVEENGKEMLVHNPKDKWVLLKLLDDDYLWSMLTEQSYEVTGKREL